MSTRRLCSAFSGSGAVIMKYKTQCNSKVFNVFRVQKLEREMRSRNDVPRKHTRCPPLSPCSAAVANTARLNYENKFLTRHGRRGRRHRQTEINNNFSINAQFRVRTPNTITHTYTLTSLGGVRSSDWRIF